MKYSFNSNLNGGFTLIELVIVVALVAIMSLLAGPGFKSYFFSSKAYSEAELIASSITQARSEAVDRYRGNVVICVSVDRFNCIQNSSDWHQGWIMFADSNGDGVRSKSEKLIYTHYGIDDITITSIGLIKSGIIRFDIDGNPGSAGKLLFCDHRGDHKAKVVIMNSVGFVRTSENEVGLKCP